MSLTRLARLELTVGHDTAPSIVLLVICRVLFQTGRKLALLNEAD